MRGGVRCLRERTEEEKRARERAWKGRRMQGAAGLRRCGGVCRRASCHCLRGTEAEADVCLLKIPRRGHVLNILDVCLFMLGALPSSMKANPRRSA